MTALAVRDAELGDALQLASLLDQLGYPIDEGSVRHRLGELLQRQDSSVIVAAEGTRVLGLGCLQIVPLLHQGKPVGFVTALVVDQHARGRGLGRRLLEELERLARNNGCGRFLLTSGNHRSEAHAFYNRLGFESNGRRFAKSLS